MARYLLSSPPPGLKRSVSVAKLSHVQTSPWRGCPLPWGEKPSAGPQHPRLTRPRILTWTADCQRRWCQLGGIRSPAPFSWTDRVKWRPGPPPASRSAFFAKEWSRLGRVSRRIPMKSRPARYTATARCCLFGCRQKGADRPLAERGGGGER